MLHRRNDDAAVPCERQEGLPGNWQGTNSHRIVNGQTNHLGLYRKVSTCVWGIGGISQETARGWFGGGRSARRCHRPRRFGFPVRGRLIASTGQRREGVGSRFTRPWQRLPDTTPSAPQAADQFANMPISRRDPPARSRIRGERAEDRGPAGAWPYLWGVVAAGVRPAADRPCFPIYVELFESPRRTPPRFVVSDDGEGCFGGWG